jgi:prevent-host-death family protein
MVFSVPHRPYCTDVCRQRWGHSTAASLLPHDNYWVTASHGGGPSAGPTPPSRHGAAAAPASPAGRRRGPCSLLYQDRARVGGPMSGLKMRTVGIHEARRHLPRLVEQASKGESFIIAKAGKPMAKIVPLEACHLPPPRRLGFLAGEITVPDDFDRMDLDEITRRFGVTRARGTPAVRATLPEERNARVRTTASRRRPRPAG